MNCKQCNESFRTKHEFKKHQKQKHPREAKPVNVETNCVGLSMRKQKNLNINIMKMIKY